MTLPSPGAIAQRRLLAGIAVATLLAWAVAIGALARGGRADPPSLRAAATLLDGDWRLRTRDEPHATDPRLDDGA